MSPTKTAYQAGVIAYRVVKSRVQVLLVTSRDTHRWIIPKGNVGHHMNAAKAAKREAYEEAGIRGSFNGDDPLGFYTYSKRLADNTTIPASVEVYLLRVKEELATWPEMDERKLCWLPLDEAIKQVEEPGVVPLLTRLAEFEEQLVAKKRKSKLEAVRA